MWKQPKVKPRSPCREQNSNQISRTRGFGVLGSITCNFGPLPLTSDCCAHRTRQGSARRRCRALRSPPAIAPFGETGALCPSERARETGTAGRQVVRDPPTRGWAPTADRAAAGPRYKATCQKATSIRYRTHCLRLRVVINGVTRVNCTPSCLWPRAKAYLPKQTSFRLGWLFYSLSHSSLRMSAVETK